MATSLTSAVQSLGNAFGLAPNVSNAIAGVGGILGGIQSSNLLSQAGQTAYQGGQYSALSYRDAGDAALEYAKYNAQITSMNLAQQLSELSSQQAQVASLQKVQMAASGVALSSQSYLSVASATIDSFARKKQSLQLATDISNQSTLFQGQISKVQAENQARQAAYQGELQRAQYNQQKDTQDFDNFLNVATGITSFFL